MITSSLRPTAPGDNGEPQLYRVVVDGLGEQLVELLGASPGAAQHSACGVRRRPCSDCRRTAPLECLDPLTCGITDFCRPCAATWRCRLWPLHPRHVREFHVWVEKFPALARLHEDPETAAALFACLRLVCRREIRRALDREREHLAADLPAIMEELR